MVRWGRDVARLLGWRGEHGQRGAGCGRGHPLVGCGDGKIRALAQGEAGAEAPVVWTLEAPGLSDSITALAAGRVAPDSPIWIVAGSQDGFVFAAQTDDPSNPPQIAPGWPQQIEKGPILCSIVLRAPIRLGEDLRDLAIIASDGGLIDLRASMALFPARLAAPAW
jgi:hypothetical protein